MTKEQLYHCANCNEDYDFATRGAICPHKLRAEGGKDRLEPWPQRSTALKPDAVPVCIYRRGCDNRAACWEAGHCTSKSVELVRDEKLLRAIQFCLDMADEEYPHQLTNPGAEIVLRHIARKCREALADFHGESP